MFSSEKQPRAEVKEQLPRQAETGTDDSTEHAGDGNVTKVVHADGTVDYIDTKAVGGDYGAMPPGYFRSPQFLGTLTVCLSRNPKKLRPSLMTTVGAVSGKYMCLLGMGSTRKHPVISPVPSRLWTTLTWS